MKKLLEAMVRWFSRFIRTRKPPVMVGKRKPRKYRKRTIADTLDKLDRHFSLLQLADEREYSENNWAARRGLRKVGPYVVPPGFEKVTDRITHDKRPSIMFIAPNDDYIHQHRDTFKVDGEWVSDPAFLYAVKQEKSPLNVIRGEGDIYEIGLCWKVQGRKKEESLLWWTFFASIEDNIAVPLRYQCSRGVALPIRRGKRNEKRIRRYSNTDWTYGEKCNDSVSDMRIWVQELTHEIFNFWQSKNKMWVIIAKKGKQRMNFSVETKDTKYYFKDRDRKGVTKNGKLRPIIHFVEGHKRTLPSGKVTTVMSHIRGLRQFLWNGYHINVKAPKYGGSLMFDKFDIAGIDTDEDDIGVETITLPQIATRFNPHDDAIQINAKEYLEKKK